VLNYSAEEDLSIITRVTLSKCESC